MKKLKMTAATFTFEEGCNKYLEYCRQRNLRDGTIRHYRQSYLYFYKYFDPKMPIEDIDGQTYKDYVLHLKATLHNDVSINSYLRDLITTLHFFMNEGWLPHFKMQAIKVDKSPIETYDENELQRLLKKPNIKKCNFTEYQCWVITNFLFSTGVRQRSLMHIQIKDLDFDNNVVYVNVTKNRKFCFWRKNTKMFKHKPCKTAMKIFYQNFRLGEYPQTHTCPKCGAYIYIDKIGLVQYFKQDGNQISNPAKEFEKI